MKKIFLVLILISSVFVSKGQSNSTDKQAIEMLKEFYRSHCKIWAIKPPPPPKIFYSKLDSLQRIYCTQKLIKEAKESFSDVGYDVFTGDWGIDIESLKTMTIVKDPTKERSYIVSYIVVAYPQSPAKPVKEHVILHVTLINEKGRLKISSIKDSTIRVT